MRSKFGLAWLIGGFVFLYLPIVTLIVFSFAPTFTFIVRPLGVDAIAPTSRS